ncbi:MAG: hypothetical protein ACLTWL_15300 [Eubacterium callanderi]
MYNVFAEKGQFLKKDWRKTNEKEKNKRKHFDTGCRERNDKGNRCKNNE